MPRRHDTEQMKLARKQVARNIQAAIDDSGMSQADLGKAIKAKPSAVNNWCKGRSVPALENLILIARVTRQSVSWLVGDALHGFDTLERFERDLAVRLGGERLRALSEVPDDDLLPQIDLLIRSRPSPSEINSAVTKPTPIRRHRRK